MIGNVVTINLEMPCHNLQGSTKSKGKVVPVHDMKAYMGEWGIDLLILNLSTRGRQVTGHFAAGERAHSTR